MKKFTIETSQYRYTVDINEREENILNILFKGVTIFIVVAIIVVFFTMFISVSEALQTVGNQINELLTTPVGKDLLMITLFVLIILIFKYFIVAASKVLVAVTSKLDFYMHTTQRALLGKIHKCEENGTFYKGGCITSVLRLMDGKYVYSTGIALPERFAIPAIKVSASNLKYIEPDEWDKHEYSKYLKTVDFPINSSGWEYYLFVDTSKIEDKSNYYLVSIFKKKKMVYIEKEGSDFAVITIDDYENYTSIIFDPYRELKEVVIAKIKQIKEQQ